MLMKIKAKGKGTVFNQNPRYLKHLKCIAQKCPKAFNYKHLVEPVNHLDIWIFEWGKRLVILVYFKKNQKGTNIGKRKGACFFLPMNKGQRNKTQGFFLLDLACLTDHFVDIFFL